MPKRGARSTPLKAGPGGRLGSARSKTGDPQCSAAMSTWVRARHGGAAVGAAVFAMLAQCRAKARALSNSRTQATVGNEAKSQVWAKRAERGLSGAARKRKAAELRAEMPARRAARAAAKAKAKEGGFSLKQESAAGRKSFRTENSGGRTGFMFDMKKGDLPGQTSLLDRVGTVRSNPRAERYGRMGAPAEVHGELARLRAGRAAELRGNRAEKRARAADQASRAARASAGGHSPESDAAILHNEFRKHPRGDARTNFVPIYELRDRTGLPKERFDAAFKHLQKTGHFAAEVHEGLITSKAHDIKRLKAEGIPQHFEGSSPYAWVALRDHGRPYEAPKAAAAKQLGRHIPRISGGSPEAILEHGRRAIERRSKTAERLRRAREMRNEHSHPELYGKPDTPYQLSTGKIDFDPERFQYKLGAQGSHGVTDTLKDVQTWNPKLAGIVSVWRDPSNGKTYVVNGHHRLDLAKRLGVDKVKVQYLDSPDAVHARAEGALMNIAEGRGTALDAAKFFRDRQMTPEGAKAYGVSLKEHTAKQGLAMSHLEDRIFRRVVDGEITPNRAAIIGAAGLTHDEQRGLMTLLDKPKYRNITDGTVRNLAHMAKEAGTKTVKTRDLFGDNEEAQSLAVHRASLEDKIKRKLGDDKRLFGLVSKSKSAQALAERADSNIDTEKTGAISQEARALHHFFDELKRRSGPLSRSLNEGAERLHAGESAKKVESEHYRAAVKHLKDMLETGGF